MRDIPESFAEMLTGMANNRETLNQYCRDSQFVAKDLLSLTGACSGDIEVD